MELALHPSLPFKPPRTNPRSQLSTTLALLPELVDLDEAEALFSVVAAALVEARRTLVVVVVPFSVSEAVAAVLRVAREPTTTIAVDKISVVDEVAGGSDGRTTTSRSAIVMPVLPSRQTGKCWRRLTLSVWLS